MTVATRPARVTLALALGAVGGLAYAPVFAGADAAFLTAVLGAVAAAGAAGVLAACVRRLSAPVAALAGLVAVVAVACLTTGTGVDLAQGPWQLLTGALPADAAGPPLAAVATVAGWVTLAAVLSAAYGRSALAPLVPPLVGLLAALSLGAAVPPLPVWYAPVVVAAAAGLLLTAHRAPAPSPRPATSAEAATPGRPAPAPALRWRGLPAAAVTVALAVLAALVVGPAMPGAGARPPADLRALVDAPVLPRSGVSPLQQYLALRDEKRPLKLTGTVSRPGTPLRLATLTRFDGSYWTVAGDFRRAGTRLPGAAAGGVAAPAGAGVSEHVTVAAGELDWLVTAGRADRVDVSGLGVDEATGDLAVPVGAQAPTAYTASGTVTGATVADILADDPVPPAGPLAPPLPPRVRSFVDTAVRDEPRGPDQLLALYKALRGGTFSDDQAAEAPGGHGYFQIERLLATKRGTSEQYASAFAVMARHLGYDARVVMGFRPRYTGEAFVVTGRDVDAWAEVRLAGSGWVPVDATPRDHPIGTREGAPPTAADDPLSEADKPQDVAAAGPDPADLATGGGSGVAGSAATVSIVVAVVAVVLLLSASPVVRTVRRTRRRRAPSDRRAILGAWWETSERLRQAGIPVAASMTTGDVVALATGRPPADDLARLARIVDTAAYAPAEPPPGLRAEAWLAAARVHRQLRAGLSPARRVAAVLSQASLLRRR